MYRPHGRAGSRPCIASIRETGVHRRESTTAAPSAASTPASRRQVAGLLDSTVASVNSALQRARAKLATIDRISSQATITEEREKRLLELYVRAWESADLDQFVALLKADAVYTMPPWREWYRGRSSIARFFASVWPAYRGFRLEPLGANLQPAFAVYTLGAEGRWNAHSVQLLSCDELGVASLTSFMQPHAQGLFTAFKLPRVWEN
jgi:RNA polymerase sigma-70 factor (ECF subfamily)